MELVNTKVSYENMMKKFQFRNTDGKTAPGGGSMSPGGVGLRSVARNARTSDGTYNDLSCPRMGSAGMRFGRNVPLSEAFPDTENLLTPSPRQVSLELMTRREFIPAKILNVIAAAWIQFMVHDWFVHKKGSWTHTHDIPLGDGDRWHEPIMRVPKTPADPPKVPDSKRPPAYINENTHWWDGSHVYGSSPSAQASLRAGREGKVLVSPSGRLALTDPDWLAAEPASSPLPRDVWLPSTQVLVARGAQGSAGDIDLMNSVDRLTRGAAHLGDHDLNAVPHFFAVHVDLGLGRNPQHGYQRRGRRTRRSTRRASR